MGFMDKVKSVAQDAATQAKSATSQAQTKIEQSQLQSKMDGLAKQLGYAVYNERAKGGPAAGNDALVAEMKSIEDQIAALAQTPASADVPPNPTGTPGAAPVSHTDATPAPPAPSTSASDPAPGDFKL